MSSGKIWVAIPCHNHREQIFAVLESVPSPVSTIVVVDDASEIRIQRKDLPPDPRICLVSHDANLGKGAAIRSAAHLALAEKAECLVTLDADGQHNAAEIRHMAAPALEGFRGIVIGVRDFKGRRIPWTSRAGRFLSNLAVFLETGIWIRDTQSGFRLYPVEIFRDVEFAAGGYQFETEVLVKSVWKGCPVREVDVSVEYPPERISHFKMFRDNLKFVRLHLALICQSLCRIFPRKGL